MIDHLSGEGLGRVVSKSHGCFRKASKITRLSNLGFFLGGGDTSEIKFGMSSFCDNLRKCTCRNMPAVYLNHSYALKILKV